MKKIHVSLPVLIAGVLATTNASASGFKIPENSVDAVGLSSAYVASARGADAAYYNPAAMSFSDAGAEMEMNGTWIDLSKINFNGTVVHPKGVVNQPTAISEPQTTVGDELGCRLCKNFQADKKHSKKGKS